MQLMGGDGLAKEILSSLASRVSKFKNPPSLHVILIGDDPASQLYVSKKSARAKEVGILGTTHVLSKSTSAKACNELIQKLNADPAVTGILLQRPLPGGFDSEFWISPEKDVDCFHPENLGKLVLGLPGPKPCTPAGVLKLLEHYKIAIAGKIACVVGRSPIVGKPMTAMLLNQDATVIQTHSKTPDLAVLTRQADILVVAAGKQGLIGAKHVKKGAVVIDVGIHRSSTGQAVHAGQQPAFTITGDVDFEAIKDIASAITPVPGGVGPLTIAMLLSNTVAFAEARQAR